VEIFYSLIYKVNFKVCLCICLLVWVCHNWWTSLKNLSLYFKLQNISSWQFCSWWNIYLQNCSRYLFPSILHKTFKSWFSLDRILFRKVVALVHRRCLKCLQHSQSKKHSGISMATQKWNFNLSRDACAIVAECKIEYFEFLDCFVCKERMRNRLKDSSSQNKMPFDVLLLPSLTSFELNAWVNFFAVLWHTSQSRSLGFDSHTQHVKRCEICSSLTLMHVQVELPMCQCVKKYTILRYEWLFNSNCGLFFTA
jgi:hypothetical protein